MIKIFGLGSHQTKERTSGVDMVRILQPMAHLDKLPDFKVDIFDIHKDLKRLDWQTVAKEHDIIYLNYIGNAWAFAAMGAMARKYNRKIVFDLDDILWELKEDNPAYKVYHKGSEALKNFTAMCNEVDYMTTTNLYLKHVIAHNTYKRHNEIEIFPNQIDLNLYTCRPSFKNDHKINIVWFGSTTHFIDLQTKDFEEGIDMVFKKYPNVTLKTVGAFIPRYKNKWGQRYEHGFGHQDIYKWIKDKYPQYMKEADIVVAPLSQDLYNRGKSDIKFLEYSAAKKPGVYQNIRQYKNIVDNGENSYLAETPEEWFNAISKLIDDPKHRKKVGENAFKTIQSRTAQKHVVDYVGFFRRIMQS